MKIAIASDHAGYVLRKKLVEKLSEEYVVIDFGCFSEDSCDYPDYAVKVAEAVQKKDVDCGILLCATGIGMSIVANKFKGIRAGVCFSDETARLISEHNFVNVICIPSRIKLCDKEISFDMVYNWVKIWLSTANSNEQRHIRRIEKISLIEKQNFR